MKVFIAHSQSTKFVDNDQLTIEIIKHIFQCLQHIEIKKKEFSVSSRIREFKCFVAKLSIRLSI